MKSKSITKTGKKPIDSRQHTITDGGQWFIPAADIHETEESILFKVDMPGCSEDSISLDVRGDELVLTGHLAYDEEKDESLLYTEYDVGHYHRHFLLSGQYNLDKIDAGMKDGILDIKVPKFKKYKPKRLKVKAAA